MITLIVAHDENNCIGKQGKIPWHLSEDFARVKKLTEGTTITMGRKTWESLPKKPLPNRTNVIISSQKLEVPEGVLVYPTLELALSEHKNETIVGFGGEKIYEALLPHADTIYLTIVHTTIPDGDAFFPKLNLAEWEETEVEVKKEFTWKTLRRK